MTACECSDLEMFPREYPDDTTNEPLVACYTSEWQTWRDNCAQCAGTPEQKCECRHELYLLYLMALIVCDFVHGASSASKMTRVRERLAAVRGHDAGGCACGG